MSDDAMDVKHAIKATRSIMNRMIKANKEMEQLLTIMENISKATEENHPVFSSVYVNQGGRNTASVTSLFNDPEFVRSIETLFRDGLKRRFETLRKLIDEEKDRL